MSGNECFEKIVLIETYWNVNAFMALLLYYLNAVLIETYWNVNMSAGNHVLMSLAVLIETYWNVNETANRQNDQPNGINRNILECKWRCIW